MIPYPTSPKCMEDEDTIPTAETIARLKLSLVKPEGLIGKKATCQCDLHQLWRGDGHDSDCPEKK